MTKQKKGQMMIGIGLLCVLAPTLLKNHIAIPDFVAGLLMGLGISIEILGLIKIVKSKHTEKNSG